jgi:SOS-response transcriptional repressor LexA
VKAKSNIHYTLARLADRGFIRMPKGRSRAIQIVKPSEIMAFFETLPSGTQHIIRSIALRQRTTNEAVMREWLNERADQFRSPCSQRVRP